MNPTDALPATVAVVGSANMDMVVSVDRTARPGETILAASYAEAVGGKGLNQAVGAARVAEAHLVGAVGRDAFGHAVVASAQARGVHTQEVSRVDAPTGRALINVAADGENSIVVASLANRELKSAAVTSALDRLRPSVVLAQLEIPLSAVIAAARWCEANGTRFALNPSPMTSVPADVVRAADPLIVNAGESVSMLELLGISSAESADHSAVAAALAGVARSVVVTSGSRGSTFASPEGSGEVSATPVVIVDTTGAGDEFAGVLVGWLARGATLADSVRLASEAAARLVATPRSDR